MILLSEEGQILLHSIHRPASAPGVSQMALLSFGGDQDCGGKRGFFTGFDDFQIWLTLKIQHAYSTLQCLSGLFISFV